MYIDRDRLPDKKGFDDVQNWDYDLPDDDMGGSARLLIFGTAASGKTLAMKARLKKAIEEVKKSFSREEVKFPVITPEIASNIMNAKAPCCDHGSTLECLSDDTTYDLAPPWMWNRYCHTDTECVLPRYMPWQKNAKGELVDDTVYIGIDDVQNFASKAQLDFLKAILCWDLYCIIATIQTPGNLIINKVQTLKDFLLKRLSGNYGAYQTQAESVVERLFEERGREIIKMERPPDNEKI